MGGHVEQKPDAWQWRWKNRIDRNDWATCSHVPSWLDPKQIEARPLYLASDRQTIEALVGALREIDRLAYHAFDDDDENPFADEAEAVCEMQKIARSALLLAGEKNNG